MRYFYVLALQILFLVLWQGRDRASEDVLSPSIAQAIVAAHQDGLAYHAANPAALGAPPPAAAIQGVTDAQILVTIFATGVLTTRPYDPTAPNVASELQNLVNDSAFAGPIIGGAIQPRVTLSPLPAPGPPQPDGTVALYTRTK